jgi:hypothetical protein
MAALQRSVQELEAERLRLREVLEAVGEHPCAHADDCQGRKAKCPSCLAHAALAGTES